MAIRLLTTEEMAERFRRSPATVGYWRHIGIGPAGVRLGRRVRYDEAECDRWWELRSRGSPPKTADDRSGRWSRHRPGALPLPHGRLTPQER